MASAPSQTPGPTPEAPVLGGLFKRKVRWGLTRRGWFLAAVLALATLAVFLRGIHPFLAVTDPVQANVLAVEGWVPDYALRAACEKFKQGNYSMICVTGGPIERGAPFSEYQNYAALGAALLREFGMESNNVHAIPAPKVRRDRTYTSAIALRDWFEADSAMPDGINIVTLGPHARRSRLLYEEAFGDSCEIGVISVENEDYNPDRWWAYSQGVRTVMSETAAYLYVRLLFGFSADREAENKIGEDSVEPSP